MRTYGRTYNEDGTYQWVEVSTTASGSNDAVYITTLVQCLKLNLGESPFYGNYGIPAYRSIVTQIFPTFYALQTQTQFAQYFASLLITQQPSTTPTYLVQLVTNQGVQVSLPVAV